MGSLSSLLGGLGLTGGTALGGIAGSQAAMSYDFGSAQQANDYAYQYAYLNQQPVSLDDIVDGATYVRPWSPTVNYYPGAQVTLDGAVFTNVSATPGIGQWVPLTPVLGQQPDSLIDVISCEERVL